MAPLAARIRPQTLNEFIGQEHLLGPNKPLRLAIEDHKLFSLVFWGPPGVGKTTLAKIMAQSGNATFVELSAVSAKKEDIRGIVIQSDTPTVLFLDEIHRFTKAQQDYLLPFVESGKLILIGATTENPSFEVIAPLLSRLRVFILKELTDAEMDRIISRSLEELEKEFGSKKKKSLTIDKEAREWLIAMANGDARQCITMIENTYSLYHKFSVETLKETLQSKHLRFDKKGEEHYNTISAFIKSMRASNVDAALYYLARMVDSGEDPLFIARRMVIFASEDIGIAQPTALVVANAVFQAVHTIGYPEAQINLAHGVTYLCTAKKDRRAHDAYFEALEDVKAFGNLPIPLSLRNAPTQLMKDIGYSKGYEKYTTKSLLPEKISDHHYFEK